MVAGSEPGDAGEGSESVVRSIMGGLRWSDESGELVVVSESEDTTGW